MVISNPPTQSTTNDADTGPGRGCCFSTKASVLLLTTSYPLNAGSVSGVFVQRLAHALARHCDLDVLTPDDKFPSHAPPSPPRVHTFRYAPKSLQTLAHGAGGIVAALNAHRANRLLVPAFLLGMVLSCWQRSRKSDLIFANWSICGIAAGLVARARGVPVVVTLRGTDANKAAQSRIFRTMLWASTRLCDRVVTVSEAMAVALQNKMPKIAAKFIVIPNGVAQSFLDVPVPNKGALGVRVLCVASLVRLKSLDTLIHALAALPATYTLTLVGEGPEAATLKRLASALGQEQRLRILPFQSPERLPALFAEADVFVLPSLAEGRPNVVLEAFAAARPVIASDIDGLRELVGDNERGLLFPAGNADALAACLRRMADPALRTAFGRASRQFIVNEGLTWERTAARYMQLFEELIDRSHNA